MRGHASESRVHDRLGTVLMSIGRHDEAIVPLETAVRLDPSVAHRYHLAQVYAFSGLNNDAIPVLESILKDDRNHAPAYARLAVVLQYIGQGERAIELLDDAFGRGLTGVDLVHSYSMLATAHGRTSDAVDRVRQLTADPEIAAHIRGDLYFRLGKLLDDLGDFSAAWNAYAQGNRLVSKPFDAEAHNAKIDRVIEIFTPETIARLAADQTGNEGQRVVLVVGMPRSGTTLIEQMISAHPDAVSGGELRDLPLAINSIPGTAQGDLFPPPSRVRGGALKKARKAYLKAIDAVSAEALRVTDKLPFNFLRLGLVPAILPGAAIVHSRRHSSDTALSCFFRNFQAGNEWSTDLGSIAVYIRAYQRLMDHWRVALPAAVPGIGFVQTDYERVVATPGEASRPVIEAIGLPWNDACAAPAKAARLLPTLEPDQAGKGVYASSKGRWRRYETQLAPLIDALGQIPDEVG